MFGLGAIISGALAAAGAASAVSSSNKNNKFPAVLPAQTKFDNAHYRLSVFLHWESYRQLRHSQSGNVCFPVTGPVYAISYLNGQPRPHFQQ